MGGQEVGSLYYDLNIEDKNLNSTLDRADKKVKNFGDSMSEHWGKAVDASKMFVAGLAIAGVAVTAFGISSVNAFAEAQEVMAQTNAVIKSTGGIAGVTAEQVSELASSFQRTTKFADEVVQSGANILLTFTNIGKDVFPQATQTMLDMSQALGQDVKASAIQLGKALQDPVRGVTALRKVGVNFTEAQQDQIKVLVDSGKAMEAQKLILKELQVEFGGSAVAAGNTFAGKMEILKNSFGDFQEVVGETIVTAITPFLDGLLSWYDAMGGAEGIMKALTGALAAIQPYLPEILGALAGMAAPAIIAGIGALASAVGSFLLTLGPWALLGAGIVVVVKEIVKSMGGWDQVVKRLQPAFAYFNTLVAQAKPYFDAFMNTLKIIGQTAISFIVPVFQTLVGVFNMMLPSLAALGNTIITQLAPAFGQIWQSVVRLWNALNPALMEALKIVGIIIAGTLIAAIWLFINALNIVAKTLSFVASAIANVINWVSNLISWYGNLAAIQINLVKEMINWFGRIPAAVGSMVNSVIGWFNSLPNGVRGALSGIAGIITAPFRAAFNNIAFLWNNTVGGLSFKMPNWVPGVGGNGFSMPKIPMLATGGIATGPVLAQIGEAGQEAVLPLSYMNRYSTLFDRIETTANNLTKNGGVAANGQPVEVHLHMDGVLARSATDMRDLFVEGIGLVNQQLRAKGKQEIAL